MARPNKWQNLGSTKAVKYPEKLIQLFDTICEKSNEYGEPIAILFPDCITVINEKYNDDAEAVEFVEAIDYFLYDVAQQ